jgi:hypothetical protein
MVSDHYRNCGRRNNILSEGGEGTGWVQIMNTTCEERNDIQVEGGEGAKWCQITNATVKGGMTLPEGGEGARSC